MTDDMFYIAHRVAAFKARVRRVSDQVCPRCGNPTTRGMLAYLGTCSACKMKTYEAGA